MSLEPKYVTTDTAVVTVIVPPRFYNQAEMDLVNARHQAEVTGLRARIEALQQEQIQLQKDHTEELARLEEKLKKVHIENKQLNDRISEVLLPAAVPILHLRGGSSRARAEKQKARWKTFGKRCAA